MKIEVPYHSAYDEESYLSEPIDRFESERIVAMRHDVREPLPSEFASVDCLYSELPWPGGFRKFNSRAGVAHESYRSLFYTLGVSSARSMLRHFGLAALPCWQTPRPMQTVCLSS